MEIEVTVTIEAPVGEVFEACDSAKSQLIWMESLVAVELTPGSTWGKGARFCQVHEHSGMRQEFEGTILEHDQDEQIELELSHSDFSIRSEIRFEDLGETTRIVQRHSITLYSIALKVARAMIQGVLRTRFEDDLERLKNLVENGE